MAAMQLRSEHCHTVATVGHLLCLNRGGLIQNPRCCALQVIQSASPRLAGMLFSSNMVHFPSV